MSPSGGAADIDGYEASGLPSGLVIDTATGVIRRHAGQRRPRTR